MPVRGVRFRLAGFCRLFGGIPSDSLQKEQESCVFERGATMNDLLERRVRAAAAAAWWTVLVAFIFLIVQWILYLTFMSSRPSWLLWLWGPDVTWPFVRAVWFWAAVGIKAFLWILALAALWLTLWSRQLRKHSLQ